MQRRRTVKIAVSIKSASSSLSEMKLLIDPTPLGQAGSYGDFAIHERDHISYWAELVKDVEGSQQRVRAISSAGEWRITRRRASSRFSPTDASWAEEPYQQIVSRLHLPPKDTETGTDSHYRCFRCLGHGKVKQ